MYGQCVECGQHGTAHCTCVVKKNPDDALNSCSECVALWGGEVSGGVAYSRKPFRLTIKGTTGCGKCWGMLGV